MSPTPTAYAEFGQTLAFTERTMSTVLREHLAERDVKPETWYALKLVATSGPGADRDAIRRDLEGSRGLTPDSTRNLLARLEADGLLTGGPVLDLTERGRELFESLREYVLGATAALLDQFDLHDIETTVRTLRAITSLAGQEPPSIT
jgi:DNA-binding MarR family transcriptional regulator